MNSVYLPDPATVETMPPEASPSTPLPSEVTKRIIGGTSTLGASLFMERGAGFLANILAARLGGAATFGAYSLALTQANNISTYAAGGIGATAARFSGKYPFGTAGYKTLARALIIVSLVSAALASTALWFGAAPIAGLLHKESLTGLLRWAALSSAGVILLECARGFFVGQRRHTAMLLLSLLVAVGMISLIPFAAARHNPIHMIVSQGIITTSAVIVCLLLARTLGLQDHSSLASTPLRPMLREVWTFGFIQLAGLVGCNLAGWWLTTLVARSDTALVQMGFLAIASQLRNMVALPPALLTEGSYAMMADRDGENSRTPSHVMALCTFGSTFASLALASVGIVIIPWALKLVYGSTYSTAGAAAAVALAVAVVHMGNAPASARLSVVSIRSAGVVNTCWAIFVAVAASVFVLHHGSAARAMTIYLAAHLLASTLVLIVLAWKDHMPRGVVPVFCLACAEVIALAGLSVLRDQMPQSAFAITAAMVALSVVTLTILFFVGRRNHWLPTSAAIGRLLRSAPAFVSRMFRPAPRRPRGDA